MVHKGDIKIVAQMLRNLEEKSGKVDFKAPLVVAAPTYNIIEELKDEGDWEILQKYSGFEFSDEHPKTKARTEYENILYLERPGCNLCMGNQEKAAKVIPYLQLLPDFLRAALLKTPIVKLVSHYLPQRLWWFCLLF